ncbi:hypothetical protein, partial [Myroides sp. WP-1]|uniref:hypothetical protein n=1 Tax=Myroides sp. WP-1 TaxID=2759944 RepID=UPI0015FC9EEF
TLTYADEDKIAHDLVLGTGAVSYDAATNTLTYVDATGTSKDFVFNETDLSYDKTTKELTYTNSLGNTQTISIAELLADSTTNTLELTGNSLKSTVNGVSSTVTLTEGNIVSTAGITSTSITVGNGAESTLKDVTLEITAGTNGQVMVTKEGKPTWTDQSDLARNIYTHDGTLINAPVDKTRRVSFGEFDNLTYQKADQSHEFTYDPTHVGLNMFGKTTASIGLISNEGANGEQSQLNLSNNKNIAEINVNTDNGLRVVSEYRKNIAFSTSERVVGGDKELFDNVIFNGDGGVQIVNINKPAFKGSQTDKVVVADQNGVLKALKAAMPKFFYMPSVMVPTAENQVTQSGVTFDNTSRTGTIDLYAIYEQQFGSPIMSSVPGSILPVLPASELIFHVTYATPGVFTIESISATGLMTYKVNGSANINMGSFINIVFSVNENN